MKLIDRYEFTNGKRFETHYLEPDDPDRFNTPECDVIAFAMYGEDFQSYIVMRPDEALIQARMLIDAVRAVTEGYSISAPVYSDNQQVFAAERE